MNVIDAITASNEADRLALGVYLVHGYPSLEQSQQAYDLLRTYEATIFEGGLPVNHLGKSSNVSDIIREAHHVASQTGLSDEEFLDFYGRYRPNLLMHTEDGERQDMEQFRDRVRGSIDTVMTDNTELAAMLGQSFTPNQSSPLSVPFISALSESPEQEVSEQTALAYVGVASRAGGELLPLSQIQATVDKVKKAAPNAKIICGMGICTADDVREISRLSGIHGVSIGTEAMRRLNGGISDFESWLSEIVDALVGEPELSM